MKRENTVWGLLINALSCLFVGKISLPLLKCLTEEQLKSAGKHIASSLLSLSDTFFVMDDLTKTCTAYDEWKWKHCLPIHE